MRNKKGVIKVIERKCGIRKSSFFPKLRQKINFSSKSLRKLLIYCLPLNHRSRRRGERGMGNIFLEIFDKNSESNVSTFHTMCPLE